MSSSSSSTLTGLVMKLSIPDANASLLKEASEYAVQQQIQGCLISASSNILLNAIATYGPSISYMLKSKRISLYISAFPFLTRSIRLYTCSMALQPERAESQVQPYNSSIAVITSTFITSSSITSVSVGPSQSAREFYCSLTFLLFLLFTNSTAIESF